MVILNNLKLMRKNQYIELLIDKNNIKKSRNKY
jgi:hypothetical protein